MDNLNIDDLSYEVIWCIDGEERVMFSHEKLSEAEKYRTSTLKTLQLIHGGSTRVDQCWTER